MSFYEAPFSCGLRFLVHPFIMQLLSDLNATPSQLVSNAWRTIIGCMPIWVFVHDGDMITLNEFLYLYRLKPSTHYGYFEHLGIRSLESFVASLLPFVIGSHDISSFLDLDGKPYLTTCGVRSRGCYRNGESLLLVSLFLIDCFEFYFFSNLFFVSSFAVANYPLLEEHYQGQIKAALEFALTVDNFVELVDPRRLYECCLRPKPFAYILKGIAREEKSRILVLSCLYLIDFHPTNLLFAEMAIRYNKNKYAHVKNLKNEPLSLITPGSKKRKLDERKNETPAL